MEGNKKGTIACSLETCQYHVLTESIIGDLKEAVQKLMEGQEQMKDTVIQLAEAFKSVERIDRRLEKIEDHHRLEMEKLCDDQKDKDEKQDDKIDNLKSFMYKTMGVTVGGVTVLSILIQVIVVLL